MFRNYARVYNEALLAPQAGGPPLVGCPQLLIEYIHSYPPYWRPFLHPQPEGVLCHGKRDPLNIVTVVLENRKMKK
jgi:hypothetical protein